LLSQIKTEIDEVDPVRARELIESGDPLIVDVREQDEWDEGHVPGAIHIPRGHLESRIEAAATDRSQPILLYCSAGNRSAFAAKTLRELGYDEPVSLAGGFTDWKRNGFPVELSAGLDPQRRARYSRHLLIPEVGEQGQLKLLDSKILLIGAGGLGSPASLYLAAAGVGRLGIVDADVVDESNLQRQIVHSTERLGEAKVDSAKRTIEALNPDVEVVAYKERLTSENIDRILADGWDVIIDGADNFPTRYLVNDACVLLDKPNVYGSIFRFEGQASVFYARQGPCYRCLYSEPPPPGLVPSCAEGGVLGVLPGIIGSIQAMETIKLILGAGQPLIGRLVLFDALKLQFRELKLEKDPDCPVCGSHPTVTELIDYQAFCGIGAEPSYDGAEITAQELRDEWGRNPDLVVIDVREPHEHEIAHIDGAVLIPLGELPDRLGELDGHREIVTHCHHGARSLKALEILKAAGFSKVRSLRGGIDAWAVNVDPSLPRY